MASEKVSGVDYVRESNRDSEQFSFAQALVASKWQGTTDDKKEMAALGRAQVLRRNFKFLPTVGFACTMIATWETIVTTLFTALGNGGSAGLIWGYLAVVVGFIPVYLSIGEMASMAPTSGGQYHWTSEFAPRSCQKFLSYIVGWLLATGWQSAVAGIGFQLGGTVQGLIILNHETTYHPEPWQVTLMIIAFTSFAIFFNTFLASRLPLVEGLSLVLNFLGLFAIIIPLWTLAELADPRDVFFTFNNGGGWSSVGGSTLVGLLGPVISMLGFDCIVHMSEEVHNASYTLPRALLSSVVFNAVLGFVVIITLCFTLGNVEDVVSTATGYPYIQIFFNATRSYAGASVMVLIILLTLVAASIAEVACASRQLWSLARDKGVPGHEFLAKVVPGWNIPLNAVMFSFLVATLLSLINLGSAVALNAVLSLGTAALITSYFISIACIALKRIQGQPLPQGRFSLGSFGLVINIISLLFLAPLFVLSFFPPSVHVAPDTMNFAIVMYAGVILIATVYYLIQGRRTFVPPVSFVKRDDEEYEQ